MAESTRRLLTHLNFFSILENPEEDTQLTQWDLDDLIQGDIHVSQGLPVIRLRFSDYAHDERRRIAREFTAQLRAQLDRTPVATVPGLNGLLMLLHEIAKNAADHSDADAVFGLDWEEEGGGVTRLRFVFGDMGPGIKEHITRHSTLAREERRRHMSLYEAYRLALLPGFTSGSNPSHNRGLGMSIIVDAARALGLHLSVFDAWSRGVLTALVNLTAPSHSSIRRAFHNVGHDTGFMYFGEHQLTSSRYADEVSE